MTTADFLSVFISDVHLGTANCQAKYLLKFLREAEFDNLYLVGDIVDLLAARKKAQFSLEQQQVIEYVLTLPKRGKRVVYIPGNHDASLRRLAGQKVAGVEFHLHIEYQTLDKRRFFVSHGDEFDSMMQCAPLLNWLGDTSHELLLKLNTVINAIRRSWGLPYWSLARSIKTRIGSAQAFIEHYERLAAKRAYESGYDGYICGHIHHWHMKQFGASLYLNDGDWVEHCSTLVETRRGEWQLWQWADQPELLARELDLSPEVENVSDIVTAKA